MQAEQLKLWSCCFASLCVCSMMYPFYTLDITYFFYVCFFCSLLLTNSPATVLV
ncbi:hypothetical protein PAHAL_3G141000 [Panicum hallii]|uniref:Uncharacterized protein n=1 Tax=Panicum hallii TaxID=206008 RepID=A0A2T8KI80_9POAL|nr:hypothetical protein PAHAL_3G141000 [Panicum hallii]